MKVINATVHLVSISAINVTPTKVRGRRVEPTFQKCGRVKAGPALGQGAEIQMLLGRASLQATEKYLGSKQDLEHAPNDAIRVKGGCVAMVMLLRPG